MELSKYEKSVKQIEPLVHVIEVSGYHRRTGWWGSYRVKDGVSYIIIERNQPEEDKYEVLKEEFSHLVTSVGMVVNQTTDTSGKKLSAHRQELIARHLSYKQLVTIDDLIECWHLGLVQPWEVAEHLDLGPEFVQNAFNYLKDIYPAEFIAHTDSGNYRVIVSGTFRFSKITQ